MKHIVINFRGGGKIKLPTNILKSIDVPDDFTVNKEGEDSTNKRICIGNGCYVDSLDETKSLEEQLVGKKCYTSDDFSNNQLVNNGDYNFLEEILDSYTHNGGLVAFSTANGIINDEFGYRESLVPVGYTQKDLGNDNYEITLVYSADTGELNIGADIYLDDSGTTKAPDNEYSIYDDITMDYPAGAVTFIVKNGKITEFPMEEEEGGEE